MTGNTAERTIAEPCTSGAHYFARLAPGIWGCIRCEVLHLTERF